LCPLASIDTEADRVAAAEWIEVILELSNVKLAPGQRNLLTSAIRNLAETTLKNQETGEELSFSERVKLRSLTHFSSSIQDREIRAVLDYYTGNKDAGTLFDGVTNDIEYKKLTVFEMDYIQNMSQRIFIPAFLFLFREVEKRISESRREFSFPQKGFPLSHAHANANEIQNPPSLIIIDEAWLALKDEMFRGKVREWLLTLRKKNCAVVLATQEVSEIVNSPIRDTILDSCRTKILLPNQNARSEGMRVLYKEHLGMNERQIELISQATPKRQYYFVNNHSRAFRLFDLGLGAVSLSFLGASSKEDIANIRKLHSEHGGNWPEKWLRYRNLPYAADRLIELQDNVKNLKRYIFSSKEGI
jgi:type IV secretion system protein VirB4